MITGRQLSMFYTKPVCSHRPHFSPLFGQKSRTKDSTFVGRVDCVTRDKVLPRLCQLPSEPAASILLYLSSTGGD